MSARRMEEILADGRRIEPSPSNKEEECREASEHWLLSFERDAFIRHSVGLCSTLAYRELIITEGRN